MKLLNVYEVLDIIDKQLGYDFEGKEKDDHLISNKTWNSYVREYLEVRVKDPEYMRSYEEKIIGNNRHTKYREDFVAEVITFHEKQLIKQFNSNRKTTVDHELIKSFEILASALGLKVDEKIYNKRIPLTQYMKKQERKYPVPSKEGIENTRKELLCLIVDQLIDMEKVNHDVYQLLISNTVDYGFVYNPKAVEGKGNYFQEYSIDARKYLKETKQ